MIDLGTIAGPHARHHQLAAYCPRCDAWRVLPVDEWVTQGKGSLRLPLRVRCRDCGEVGQLQVRPPDADVDQHERLDRTVLK
jgi:ribosomal protein L44E